MKEKQQIKKIQKQKSAEEQGEEIEALKSIFQEDFESLPIHHNESPSISHKFGIIIDASGDKKINTASVRVEIAFGPLYPKLPPSINVIKLKGISDVCFLFSFFLSICLFF